MGYTMTFDASHKVTKQGGHSQKFIKHIGRDVDKKNGVEQKHGNKGIMASRTSHNVTLVNDGQGGYKRAESTEEMMAAVDARLAMVKPQILPSGKPKATRKDAVVIRPVILQLDPEWFDDHCPDWRETGDIGDEGRRLVSESLGWFEGEVGQENIAFTSLHLDEYSPQLQVGFVPVTKDGRLNQSAFFKGQGDLGRMHRELREHMASAGYDVTMERVTKDRTIKEMDTDEYKKYRDTLDAAARLESKLGATVAVAKRDSDQTWDLKKEAKVDRAQAADELLDVQRRSSSLDARESDIDQRDAESARRLAEASEKTELAQRALESARSAQIDAQRRADAIIQDAEARAVNILPDPAVVSKMVRDQSPDLWSKYLKKQPKVAAHFDTWAYRSLQVYKASERELNPQTHGKPHGQAEAERKRLYQNAGNNFSDTQLPGQSPAGPSFGE